jgi:molecular chaperone GrpE (heat shock protein)
LDPGIEAMIKLNIIMNDVQKGPSKLLSETKKKIQKEFPNISEQLENLFINTATSSEKFEIIKDPKEFLDKQFAKISNPTELNLLLSSNLPQEDLIKVYNLILYKFSTDLTELGFEKLGNQEIDFSPNVKNAEQILEQVQLQQDITAIVSLLGSDRGNQGLSSLII